MKIKNFKIVTKLQIGFSILLFFVFVLGIVSYYQTKMIYQQTVNMYEHPLKVNRAVGILNTDILNMRLGTRNLMLGSNKEEQQAAIESIDSYALDAHTQFDVIRSQYLGPMSDVEEANMAFMRWETDRKENVKLSLAGEIETVKESVDSSGTIGLLREDMLSKIKVIENYAKNKADTLFSTSTLLYELLTTELIVLIVFMVLLSGLVIYWLLKAVRTPIKDLTLATERFHKGDLSARSTYESEDEFGVLSKSFNTLAMSIQQKSTLDNKIAELASLMINEYDMKLFFRSVLNSFAAHTNSMMAAVYLLSDDKKSFRCFESFGLDEHARQMFDAENMEGEFGIVLSTKKMHHLKDIPANTRFVFNTVCGKFIPSEIITIPLIAENEVIAVVTLASVNVYSEESIRLIDSILVTLCTRVEGILAYHKMKEFLKKLEFQNSELEMQKSELSAQSAELMKQNTELEIQKNQLGEVNRLKTSFLSNMSHELRTPLNSVIALSGVLSRRLSKKISEEESGYLEVIERNGKHLLLLINDVLDISRIEAGREELEITTFKPCMLVNDLVDMIRPQAKQKGIELKMPEGHCEVAISSDADKFYHIMQNLIGNAVKFTEKGTVSISAVVHEKSIAITVADTGIGISEANIEHVFEEFRQADSSTSRRFGGTGLGLAIAQKYAHLLGASISVKSTPGVGSEFTLEMPLTYTAEDCTVVPKAVTEVSRKEKMSVTQPMATVVGKTILLVEDSEPAIIQLKDFMEEFGYKLLVAHNAMEGLAIIEETIPDAMILDLMMPDIDGFRMLEMLRNAEHTAHVPVLILTAKHITKEELSFLKRNHIYQLIRKGDVNRIELLNAVAAMVAPKEVAEEQLKHAPQVIEGKPVILVVEDNPDNMVTARAVLSNEFTVLEATDGYSGVEMAKKHLPHLILMDIALPDIDGIAAFKMIRKDPRMQYIPVIALTASAMTCDREAILAHGFDAFIAKPIEEKLFLKTINKMLYGK